MVRLALKDAAVVSSIPFVPELVFVRLHQQTIESVVNTRPTSVG